jgi:hypothetical protein
MSIDRFTPRTPAELKAGLRTHRASIETWDVSHMTDFSEAFHGERVQGLRLDQWDVSNGTNFTRMFAGSLGLTVDLSRWNMANAQLLDGMFIHCRDFRGGNVSSWRLPRVHSARHMCFDCHQWIADVSRWELPSLLSMDGMFQHCFLFQSDLSAWRLPLVQTMSYAFAGCVLLQSDLSRWTVSQMRVCQFAFLGCGRLHFDLRGWAMPHLAQGVRSSMGMWFGSGMHPFRPAMDPSTQLDLAPEMVEQQRQLTERAQQARARLDRQEDPDWGTLGNDFIEWMLDLDGPAGNLADEDARRQADAERAAEEERRHAAVHMERASDSDHEGYTDTEGRLSPVSASASASASASDDNGPPRRRPRWEGGVRRSVRRSVQVRVSRGARSNRHNRSTRRPPRRCTTCRRVRCRCTNCRCPVCRRHPLRRSSTGLRATRRPSQRSRKVRT